MVASLPICALRSLPLLLVLLARVTAQDCGNHEQTTQHTLITSDGRSRFYLKYTPPGVTTASNYPLVIERAEQEPEPLELTTSWLFPARCTLPCH